MLKFNKEGIELIRNKIVLTDNDVTVIDIDGCKNPIGVKSYVQYFDFIFSALSTTQAHGNGVFDIKYCIL